MTNINEYFLIITGFCFQAESYKTKQISQHTCNNLMLTIQGYSH